MYRQIHTVILVVLLTASACTRSNIDTPTLRLSGPTMGTSYTVTLHLLPNGLDADTLQRDIGHILDRINDQMSTYQESSELSRLNQNHTTEWVTVSPQLFTVVDMALRMSRITNGAFDVTVGTLVNLWGFGPSIPKMLVPSDEVIDEAMRVMGYEHLHTRSSPPAIRKDIPGLYVDLSGIAKGYAVDKIAEHLESIGVENYLVELGGELRSHGQTSKGILWEVSIERPIPLVQEAYRAFPLRDRAIATSGDYRDYFERDGKRFSHTIDPRTGKPVAHDVASVTVIDTSAMKADALATGLTVLGLDAGYDVAVRENVAALFLVRHEDGFRETATPAWARHLDLQ